MYHREYQKIYETYVKSRQKVIKEDLNHVVPGPGEVAAGDHEIVPPSIQSANPPPEASQPVNTPSNVPQENETSIIPPTAGLNPVQDEKQVYLNLVQQIMMHLTKADNLTPQEIDNVFSVLHKAKFVT